MNKGNVCWCEDEMRKTEKEVGVCDMANDIKKMIVCEKDAEDRDNWICRTRFADSKYLRVKVKKK